MGWEYRGGKKYYYRKIRSGRHVFSKYCGSDLFAFIADAQDVDREISRMKDRMIAIDQRKHIKELRDIDRQIEGIEETIRAIYHGALLASGYHTHSRQWRKKRCHKP